MSVKRQKLLACVLRLRQLPISHSVDLLVSCVEQALIFDVLFLWFKLLAKPFDGLSIRDHR